MARGYQKLIGRRCAGAAGSGMLGGDDAEAAGLHHYRLLADAIMEITRSEKRRLL